MMTTINDVVHMGLCIGCMACIDLCPLGRLEVKEGDFGYPLPLAHQDCNNCGVCLQECCVADYKDE